MKNYLTTNQIIDTVNFTKYSHKSDSVFNFITAEFKKTALNPDGSPRAYHPKNSGILYNLNGGISLDPETKKANTSKAFAIYRDVNKKPIIQDQNEPFPGYFVAMTSWNNTKYKESETKRYLNSETINFIAYTNKMKELGIGKGSVGIATNLANNKSVFFVVADSRGSRTSEELEISMAMANNLEIPITWKKVKNYENQEVEKVVGIKNTNIFVKFFTSTFLSQALGIENQQIIDSNSEIIKKKIDIQIEN